MRSPSNKTLSPACPYTEKAFIMQSDATLSDQIAQPTIATSTSLSAATPRICQPLPHETARLMEAASAHNTLEDVDPITYTAGSKQSPETMACTLQPAASQSSQLDSMLLSKLPRELRDNIYREAVVEDKDIPIRVTCFETEGGERRRRLQIGHALMRVSKQTAQEVADIYYLENKFRITGDLIGKRAIRELSRLLTPWVGKVTKLGVSHSFLRSRSDLAKINFSISASQGRIVVKPESSSVQYHILAFDLGQGTAEPMSKTSNRICFCKTYKLALEHDGRDILSWIQEYMDLVLQSESQATYNVLLDVAHCWTCAGRNVI